VAKKSSSHVFALCCDCPSELCGEVETCVLVCHRINPRLTLDWAHTSFPRYWAFALMAWMDFLKGLLKNESRILIFRMPIFRDRLALVTIQDPEKEYVEQLIQPLPRLPEQTEQDLIDMKIWRNLRPREWWIFATKVLGTSSSYSSDRKLRENSRVNSPRAHQRTCRVLWFQWYSRRAATLL